MTSTHHDIVRRASTGLLFLLAVLAIVTFLGDRILDWEEYRLVGHDINPLNASFLDYVKSQKGGEISNTGSAWVCYRLFGGNIKGLRLPSMLCGVVSLLLVFAVTRKLLCERNAAVFMLFAFGMNWFAIDYARWGFPSYAGVLTYSILLFYLFWKISDRAWRTRDKIAVLLLSSVGLFISYHTVPILLVGPPAVLAVHVLRSWRDGRVLIKKVKGLSLFLAYPAVGLLVYRPLVFVPILAEYNTRVHAAGTYKFDGYFAYCGLPQNMLGLAQFFLKRSSGLFFWLLHPLGFISGPVVYILVALLLIGLLKTLVVRHVHDSRFFVVVYFITGLGVLLGLSVLRLYPFGYTRYSLLLLYPALLICGYGYKDAVQFFAGVFNASSDKVVYSLLSIALCICAALLLCEQSKARLRTGREARDIIASMKGDHEILLVETRYLNVVRTRAAHNRDRIRGLRPVGGSRRNRGPVALDADLLDDLRRGRYQSILVVSWSRSGFPEATKLLERNWVMTFSTDLFESQSYREVFQKYNIHVEEWRLKTSLSQQHLRLLERLEPAAPKGPCVRGQVAGIGKSEAASAAVSVAKSVPWFAKPRGNHNMVVGCERKTRGVMATDQADLQRRGAIA